MSCFVQMSEIHFIILFKREYMEEAAFWEDLIYISP